MKIHYLIAFISFLALGSCAQQVDQASAASESLPKKVINQLPDCEWCGTDEAPDNLNWKVKIPSEGENGQPLIVSGQVFQPDGKTPANDVIIYVYHTNVEGIYPKRGDETGNAQRHGYLRAWMKTNQQGRYEFETFRPGAYPNRNASEHIHITLKVPGQEEYWLDSFVFEDDPLLSDKDKKEGLDMGQTSPVLRLVKDDQGILRGTRDIILKEK